MKSNYFLIQKRTILITGVVYFILSVINGCKKKDNVAIFDNTFKPIEQFSRSNVLPTPDSAMVQRVLDEFGSERAIFDNTFRDLYPNDYGDYQSHMKALDTITSRESWVKVHQYLDKEYKPILQDVWKQCKFDLKDFENRVRKILGDIPFKIGEFGQITGTYQPLIGAGGTTPEEAVLNFNNPFNPPYSQLSATCGLVGLSLSEVTPGKMKVKTVGGLVATCGVNGRLGTTIQMDRRFRYFRIEAKINNGFIFSGAGGLLGGGESRSFLNLICRSTDRTAYPEAHIERSIATTYAILLLAGNSNEERLLDNNTMTISGETAKFDDEVEVFYLGGALGVVGGLGGYSSEVNIVPSNIRITFFN